jgi:hypothetical protein
MYTASAVVVAPKANPMTVSYYAAVLKINNTMYK